MLSEVLNKISRKIHSLVSNYEKARVGKTREDVKRKSKELVSGMVTRRYQETMPDPWDDPLM
jgi:hypothetical protein